MGLKDSIVIDLNKLASEASLLIALEIFVPNTPVIRVVNNNENIFFKGQEYACLNFELGELVAEKGSIPQVSLRLDNTSRAITPYLHAYDLLLKTEGVPNSAIRANLYILNTIDLSMPVMEESFELSDFSIDNEWASFNLGAISLFSLEYPTRKMIKDFCGFKFKSSRCGYAGSAMECDKSLACCKRLGNSENFGGFVGIGGGVKA